MISFKFELTIGKRKFCYPKKQQVNITPSVTFKGSDLVIYFNRSSGFNRNS